MKTLKMSKHFTVDDIHNLRLYIARKHSKMTKLQAEKDMQMHVANIENLMEKFRKN
jgi:hypothetical protein